MPPGRHRNTRRPGAWEKAERYTSPLVDRCSIASDRARSGWLSHRPRPGRGALILIERLLAACIGAGSG